MEKTAFFLAALILSFCFLLGCANGGDDTFPDIHLDAATVAAQVMAEYDTDSNGEISKSELKKCKGLEMLTAGQMQMQPEYRLDQDGSGTISESEFTDKLTALFASRRQSYSCTIIYKGRPLQGATVTLVPESFMGDSVPQASGETDDTGTCSVMGEDGVQGAVPGIYRVEITHPDQKISAKYNTDSTLSTALDTTNPYAQQGTQKFGVK